MQQNNDDVGVMVKVCSPPKNGGIVPPWLQRVLPYPIPITPDPDVPHIMKPKEKV